VVATRALKLVLIVTAVLTAVVAVLTAMVAVLTALAAVLTVMAVFIEEIEVLTATFTEAVALAVATTSTPR